MAKKMHHRVVQSVANRQAAIQKGTDQARHAIRTGDSFQNVSARLGYGTDTLQSGSRYGIDFISRNPYNLEAAYRSNWLCGMAVDVIAEDMTRAGVQFQSDELKPDDTDKMLKGIETLQLWSEISDATKWGRLYGGGIAVLLIDGQDLRTPLRLDSIALGQFKGIVALDRWQVSPTLFDLVTDYGPDLGKPRYYDVNPSAKALIGERIHYSRCMRIDGLKLPFRQELAENGWGQSSLERLWDRIVAFDSTTEGAAQLVYKAHLRTIKIKGFRSLIAAGGKMYDAFIEQMKLVRSMQSNEGLTVLDGEDEFEAHSYAFSGLDNLLLQFGQQISGALQIPLVRLFGQSPAGLNSTGESDLRTYYDNIAKEQDNKLRRPLNVVFELVSRSILGKPLPAGFKFEFVPLWQLTEVEKAQIAKDTTSAICEAEASAIISPKTAAKELRNASRTTGVFTQITDEEIEALAEEPPKPDLVVPGLDVMPGAEDDATSKEPRLAAVK